MARLKTPRYVVIALLAAAILLAASTSAMGSAGSPAGASGGNYTLTHPLQCSACAPAASPAVLASGGNYRLTSDIEPVADGSGCCCKCYLPLIMRRR